MFVYGYPAGEQDSNSPPMTPSPSPSPSSDSLSSYTFLDSPTSEPATLTFDEPTPSPPVQPAPSRSQLVRRVLGIALLLCFVLGVSFRSVTINLRPSYASKPETSVVEPDPPVDDCLRDQLSACTWTLASREDDLITALGEISSAQKAGESLFWLGLGVNSWMTPTNHKRRFFGHTTFSAPGRNRTIAISSVAFSPSSPARVTAPVGAEIVGFSVQLEPDSLTFGSWKATFWRVPGGAPGVRRSLGFEARSERWLEVTRWAVSARCFGMCAEVGDPTIWANVYVAREESG